MKANGKKLGKVKIVVVILEHENQYGEIKRFLNSKGIISQAILLDTISGRGGKEI